MSRTPAETVLAPAVPKRIQGTQPVKKRMGQKATRERAGRGVRGSCGAGGGVRGGCGVRGGSRTLDGLLGGSGPEQLDRLQRRRLVRDQFLQLMQLQQQQLQDLH